ncbi:Retrovirus-related Pol polyprotein from transposon opus [Varanus komodoensis]|nr:Retrovirus-related Pol polyprotein from transposon opus [Varanus komodoensis]
MSIQRVNEVSKFDAYPMPRIDGLLDPLGQAHFLSTLDLTKEYWQIPLMEESKEKTAFATPVGLFQFKYMPFGLHGAAATFQWLMDKVLGHLSHCAAAYIDDIVIFSRTWGEHLDHLRQVLLALRQARMTANPGKVPGPYMEMVIPSWRGVLLLASQGTPQEHREELSRNSSFPKVLKHSKPSALLKEAETSIFKRVITCYHAEHQGICITFEKLY